MQLTYPPPPPPKTPRGKKHKHEAIRETQTEEGQNDSYFPTKWPNGHPK